MANVDAYRIISEGIEIDIIIEKDEFGISYKLLLPKVSKATNVLLVELKILLLVLPYSFQKKSIFKENSYIKQYVHYRRCYKLDCWEDYG